MISPLCEILLDIAEPGFVVFFYFCYSEAFVAGYSNLSGIRGFMGFLIVPSHTDAREASASTI